MINASFVWMQHGVTVPREVVISYVFLLSNFSKTSNYRCQTKTTITMRAPNLEVIRLRIEQDVLDALVELKPGKHV